jgi:S-DNA-T family DNA segregation ATPase FtsK/SpoIIIE
VNRNVDLRVSRSLGLTMKLEGAVADFNRREEQLIGESRARRSEAARKYRTATAAVDEWTEREAARIAADFTDEEGRARSIAEARRARIEHAHRGAIASLQGQARRARERWLGNLQLKHFEATRRLPVDLDAAKEGFEAFGERLGEQRERLVGLARQVRRLFFGYRVYSNWLRRERIAAAEEMRPSEDHRECFEQLRGALRDVDGRLAEFRRHLLPRVFGYLPLPLVIPLLLIAGGWAGLLLGGGMGAFVMTGFVVAAVAVVLLVFRRIGFRRSKMDAEKLATDLARAERIHDACGSAAEAGYERSRREIKAAYDKVCEEIQDQWKRAGEIESTFATNIRAKIERQAPRLSERNEALMRSRLSQASAARSERMGQLDREAGERRRHAAEAREAALVEATAMEAARWVELQAAWESDLVPAYRMVGTMNATVAPYAPPWTEEFVESWNPPSEFSPLARFGAIEFDLDREPSFSGAPCLELPGPPRVSVPLALTFPEQGSLLFETSDSGAPVVIGTLNNVVMRLLTNTPAGKAAFTLVDPVGLGQNFAGLMHLADFEESLINRRIWTQREQIEERLDELNEHIEKVIQMYLRDEYATITEYNAKAGSVAEKYHFLVVADFPENFSESAAKRLLSIAASGRRCGVFTLIHWDRRLALPDGFVPDELRKNSVCLQRDGNEWVFAHEGARIDSGLVFDAPPEPELSVRLVHRIGEDSVDSNRVEVPFAQVTPKPEELWTIETTNELRVAVGRTGATKLHYLAMGKGTRQHALIAGKTGSGKSTLFHVIITNLALACSPEQVEFYLIDFKKGVEFKCYATHGLPHARVVAIESDREFGLSVLQRVDEELKRRGDLFRKLGVQDIAGYKKAGGTEPIPRTLLMLDEFQEFFVEDDQIAQTASLLFDRIVRQGRAFGIHVVLGSQTLGGAYTLALTKLGQMAIRIALQCNEADAYLIMDDDNPAPRLLSRPGEGIYNDAAGATEGNSPFQVVWLSDEERNSQLERVRAMADERRVRRQPGPIVFEGNAPADISENQLLCAALDGTLTSHPAAPRCWLGAPNAIKGPTEVVFQRQSGNHLLIVGQRAEAMQTMLATSLIALAAQNRPGGMKFFVFHAPPSDSSGRDCLEEVATEIRHSVVLVRSHNVPDAMNELAEELKVRSDESGVDRPPVFVMIDGLQKFRKLRHEEEFDFSSGGDSAPGPGAQFNTLITEGSSHGIHLIVTLDTFNNATRFLSRRALTEFEMRVVFQMSANDSASLIDSPRASNLGLHRALFYNEHEGQLETFRPYAAPGEWLRKMVRRLAQRQAA